MRCPSVDELPSPPPGKLGWPWTEESPRLPSIRSDGNSWPRVSIVTASFNQGQYLEEAIRSVLLQGYPDLEYLVGDGGSSDGSVDIIKKYEPWLAYWVSEPDAGQSDAINKGWTRATGEVYTYLNSDDAYLPGTLAKVIEQFDRQPEAGVVYGSYTVVDETGEVCTPLVTPQRWTPDGFVNGLPAPSMFFRRSVLARTGFMDPRLHFAMDSDLCIRAALEGFRFSRIAEDPLVAVREWSGAKSFDWSQTGLTEVWLTLDRLAASPKAPASIRSRIRAIKAQACLWPAYQHLLAGQKHSALRFLAQSAAIHPPIVVSGEYLRLLTRCVVGSQSRWLVRTVRRAVAGGS